MLSCRAIQIYFKSEVIPLAKRFHFVRAFTIHSFNHELSLKHQKRKISFYSTNSSNLNKYERNITSQTPISDLEEFNAVGKTIHDDLIETDNKCIADVVEWCSKVFKYNLQEGKKLRGTAVLKSYKVLSPNTTAEGVFLACILGWCSEILHAFFLIADDIMDQSIMRRGKLCWYKKPEVGLVAVNDSTLLMCGIYKILQKHFKKNNELYMKIVHQFLKATEKTSYGQCLDMLNNPLIGKSKFENFTSEKYQTIVEYKTSHYTFCLPVHLAMQLIGYKSEKDFQITEQICYKIGLLFQIQDDYLDCYGDPKVTGKQGTDISQSKCSWFAVTFLENATESLKQQWMENYGIDSKESVSKVKLLYQKLNMLEKYFNFEQKLYMEIVSLVNNELTDKPMQELLNHLLNKTFKRDK